MLSTRNRYADVKITPSVALKKTPKLYPGFLKANILPYLFHPSLPIYTLCCFFYELVECKLKTVPLFLNTSIQIS